MWTCLILAVTDSIFGRGPVWFRVVFFAFCAFAAIYVLWAWLRSSDERERWDWQKEGDEERLRFRRKDTREGEDG